MSLGTPTHSVRVERDTWDAAKSKANGEGRHVGDVIRDALDEYLHDKPRNMS